MAKVTKIRGIRRGEVYLVNFDPTVGSEIKKTRPAVVIQNDTANRWSPITIVAAISSRRDDPRYPTEVNVAPPEGGLTSHSVVLLNQVRSIDKERLVRRLGALAKATMQQVDEALPAVSVIRYRRRLDAAAVLRLIETTHCPADHAAHHQAASNH